MRYIKRFNEQVGEKNFSVLDKSEGDKSTLSGSYIEKNFDLSEEDSNSKTLAEFLDESKVGEKWISDSIELTCV